MLLSSERPMARQKCDDIADNLKAVVNSIPLWGRRVSAGDRDRLIQALADLELLYNTVREFKHNNELRAKVVVLLNGLELPS